jgi:hypothetical protein
MKAAACSGPLADRARDLAAGAEIPALLKGDASFFRQARDERDCKNDGKETEPAKVAHRDPLGSDE